MNPETNFDTSSWTMAFIRSTLHSSSEELKFSNLLGHNTINLLKNVILDPETVASLGVIF